MNLAWQEGEKRMTRNELMNKAAEAGARAYQQKMGVHKNPFMEKTLFWMCWKDGYETAQGKDNPIKEVATNEVSEN